MVNELTPLIWISERHGDVIFALNGSRCSKLFGPSFELLLKSRNCDTFWRILYSGKFSQDEKKAVCDILERIASFFYHTLPLDGIYMQDHTSPKEYLDYLEYLTRLHCLLIALLAKTMFFRRLQDRIKLHLCSVLYRKGISLAKHVSVNDCTTYDLLNMCIQNDLLRDTITLNEWASFWVDSKFLTRCLSRFPYLVNDNVIFPLHPESSPICDLLWIKIINEFKCDDYRPGAKVDSEHIDYASARCRDGETLNFNNLSKEDLLKMFQLKSTTDLLQHARKIILTLSSHGAGPAFVCNDNENIDYVDLIEAIIKNAPKLVTLYIIIQACQGYSLRRIREDEHNDCSDMDLSTLNWQENLNLQSICHEGIEIYCMRSSLPAHLSISTKKNGSLIYNYMKLLVEGNPNFTKGWISVDQLLQATADRFASEKLVCGKNPDDTYIVRPVLEYFSP